MTAQEYQNACLKTMNNDLTDREEMSMIGLGLTGEAGEFADMLKKHLYHGHDFDVEKGVKELGDILWYVAVAADRLDFDLGAVMRKNVEKLNKRYGEKFSKEASINRSE